MKQKTFYILKVTCNGHEIPNEWMNEWISGQLCSLWTFSQSTWGAS